ncbi:Hsp20/alpha crystallin family protein [Dactylosporangium sp. CA-052675]|uniref:Hsp20/alpha crystallin family protein n=1 Tax=Dactylosporangium sp. CA-052675 TaxID=3239927 RepID=UPI003D902082
MSLAPFSARHRRGGGLARRPGWDPAREVDELNARFGQLIRSYFGESGLASPIAMATAWQPPVDIEETDDAYVVDVDLPNVDPSDIDLEIRGEELRISGSFEQRDRGGVMRRQARQSGEFEYVVELPSGIDADRVEATYDNGVLTITVGKTRDTHPRRIEIDRGSGSGDRQIGKSSSQSQQAGPGSPAPGQSGSPRSRR